MKNSTLALLIGLMTLSAGCAHQPQNPLFSVGIPLREVVGPSTVRMPAMNLKHIKLGQCVDYGGGLINFLCAGKGEAVNINPSERLNREQRRYYSSLTDLRIDSSVNGGYGGVATSAKTKTTLARYRMVTEWARYRSQTVTAELPSIGDEPASYLESVAILKKKPYISAVDVGISIRIIYDIQLNADTIDAALSFGIANLATAVAQNRAQVELQYDVVGAGNVKLPAATVMQISNIQQLMDAQKSFDDMIRQVRDEWAEYDNETDVVKKSLKKEKFQPGVISYEVNDLPDSLLAGSQSYRKGFMVGLVWLRENRHCNISEKFPMDYQNGIKEAFESDGKICTYDRGSGRKTAPTVRVDINVNGLPGGASVSTPDTQDHKKAQDGAHESASPDGKPRENKL